MKFVSEDEFKAEARRLLEQAKMPTSDEYIAHVMRVGASMASSKPNTAIFLDDIVRTLRMERN